MTYLIQLLTKYDKRSTIPSLIMSTQLMKYNLSRQPNLSLGYISLIEYNMRYDKRRDNRSYLIFG